MAYVVCTIALLACLWVLKFVASGSFEWFGFWGGLVFCVAGMAIFLAIARAVDARDLRRSQELQRQGRRDLR